MFSRSSRSSGSSRSPGAGGEIPLATSGAVSDGAPIPAPADSAGDAGSPGGADHVAAIAGSPAVLGRIATTGGWMTVVLVALYVATLALAARLLVAVGAGGLLPWYLALLFAYFLLFSLLWRFSNVRPALLHLVFGVQCLIVLGLLLLEPELDYATSFFVPLAAQAAVVFSARTRWMWVSGLVVLIAGSLMLTLGLLHGLGLALSGMAVAVAFSALTIASREIQTSRTESRRMVGELEETHRRLEQYAAQVEELAVLQERNRLARELHDSVSQAMFGILLATRSAQIMGEKQPEEVQRQIEHLQDLSREALARMRGFIAELRPAGARS